MKPRPCRTSSLTSETPRPTADSYSFRIQIRVNSEEIWIVVEDRPRRKSKTDWRAVIKGNELFDLCIRLPDHVEDYTK